MSVETTTGRETGVRRSTLLFALSSGMIAWMVHLAGASALVPTACEHGMGWLIDALTAVTALVCAIGIVAGVRVHRLHDPGDPRTEGLRMAGFVAISANVVSLVLVLGEGAMHLFIGACR